MLNAGYPVRGTVRSAAKGEYLADLFKGSKVPFEYVVVEDISKVCSEEIGRGAAAAMCDPD
jgi:hypothetical protein